MATIDKRIAALELNRPDDAERHFIFVCGFGEIKNIVASAHWPAMDRRPDETEKDFKDRAIAVATSSVLPSTRCVAFYCFAAAADEEV